jgi:hypothetical protein
MAGTIVADTLTHSTAGSVTTDYVVNGSAKAWGRYSHNDAAFDDSFNFSSAVDQGTGDARLTFSSAMVNDDFSCTATASNNSARICVFNEPSTTTVDIEAFGTTFANTDLAQGVTINGDLA